MDTIAEQAYLTALDEYTDALRALIVMDPPVDNDDRWDWRAQLDNVRRARLRQEHRFDVYQQSMFSNGYVRPLEMDDAPEWIWSNDLDEVVDGARRLRMQLNRRRRRT